MLPTCFLITRGLRRKRFFVTLVTLVLTFLPYAYAADSTAPDKTGTTARNPALTPTQKQGLRLVRSAEASAPGLEPGMHAFVLWQVSRAYQKVDTHRRPVLLRDAFLASTAIPDVSCSGESPACLQKLTLQDQILGELIYLSPQQVEELIPQAVPETRHNITGSLIAAYVREKKLDHARDLLFRMGDENGFPFHAAADVMQALPAQDYSERLAIFNLAFSNYRDVQEGALSSLGVADFSDLIVRFWKELPRDLVLDAIDTLLKRALEDQNSPRHVEISMSSSEDSLAFGLYEYRLFEILPVLQELDPARAASLLREHQQVSSALRKYPGGLTAVSPKAGTDHSKDPSTTFHAMSVRMGPPDPQSLATMAMQSQIASQEAAVVEKARTDPQQAFNLAMGLPQWSSGEEAASRNSPRALGLTNVAEFCVKKDPAVARKALDEAQKMADQAGPLFAAMLIGRIAGIYLKLSDPDRAEKVIRQGMKTGQRLYEIDSDSDDPNLAIKAQWLSAGFWRRMIIIGAKVSPSFAEEIIAEIRDPDIQAIEKVTLGESLLGVEGPLIPSMELRKGGIGTYIPF